MHVLQMCSGSGLNGAVLHCLLLSRELRRAGWRVTLACRPGTWLAEQAQAEAFDFFVTDFRKFSLPQIRAAAAEIRSRRVDVMHTHQSAASCFGVMLRWLTGRPSVATAHHRNLQLHWMWNDYVIGVSDSTTRFHRRVNRVSSQHSETIHYFVDWDRFNQADPLARRRVRQQWGVQDNAPLFGPIGDIVPRKGLLYLVRALPQILQRVPEARLVCVGKPGKPRSYADQVQEEAARLGVAKHIIWTGARSDVPDVLSALDLYVLPSLEECFPLSILEAMAAGLACVATNVGGLPECVVDSATGLLVPPAQPEPLAEAVVRLLEDQDLRARLASAGRQRIADCFSPGTQAQRIATILHRTAAARPRAA